MNAFHCAQARFAKKMDPPTLDDVKNGVKSTRKENVGWAKRFCSFFWPLTFRQPRGGTTALTFMIVRRICDGYVKSIVYDTNVIPYFALEYRFDNKYYGEGKNDDNDEKLIPMTHAVVANAGDCRLVTDDGSGTHTYRQVTRDHRPEDPDEHKRLQNCAKQGKAILGRDVRGVGTLRIYPGGLAVSRSVGDVTSSSAVICTPEIFRVPIATKENYGVTRFVLGSDGLWDTLSNEKVGKIVARKQTKKNDASDKSEEVIVDPNQAASELMQECLKHGGYVDDVTLIVVDVSYDNAPTS